VEFEMMVQRRTGLGDVLTQMRVGCDPTSASCVGGTDVGPSPWFCSLPSWLQTTAQTQECKYAGLIVGQPAAPTLPPFIGAGQTPADVIGTTSTADIEARLMAAADQASAQNAQVDAQTPPDAGTPSGMSPFVIGALVIAGIAALSALR
jgi:hypothetical protein